jgi:chitodextrinase
VGDTSVDLAWSAATDDVGVTGYQVVRDGTVVATVTGLSTTDTGLTPGSSHTYVVRAVDAAGNVSNDSNSVPVTTTGTAPTSLFSDLFSGADGSAWNGSWTTTTGSGTANVQSNRGALTFSDTAGAYARAQLTGLADRADSDTTFSYQWSATSGSGYFNAYTRGSGGWSNSYRPRNGYGIELFSNSGTGYVRKVVNGAVSNLQTISGFNTTTTTKQWIRIRVVGSTIQVKHWNDGQAEPTAWDSTDTDTDVTTTGQLHLSYVRGGSNTGAKTLYLDDLTIQGG